MSTRRSFLKVIGVATIGVVAPNTSGERATRGNPDQTQHLRTFLGYTLLAKAAPSQLFNYVWTTQL